MKDFNPQSCKKSSKRCDDQPILFVSAAFREQCLAQLKGAPLSVYLAYQSYANKEGIAWPSLRSLAKFTGYGINAVKRARKALVEMGFLDPIKQDREGGQFGRKKFRVNTVPPKQCHGTVAPSTVAPSTVAPKQCQEGSPSEGFPSEGFPKQVKAEESVAASQFIGGGSPLPNPTPQKNHAKRPKRGGWLSWNLAEVYGL